MMSAKQLIVEGKTDQGLFKALLNKNNLRDVMVFPPKDKGKKSNGKSNALNTLETGMDDLYNQLTHLGLVVDADYDLGKVSEGGYEKTKALVEKVLLKRHYTLSEQLEGGGLIYRNTNAPNPIGVWIMYSNLPEKTGCLEDWLMICLNDQSTLYKHAIDSVSKIPKPRLFKNEHQAKAEIATILAWQEKIGCGIDYFADSGRLNPQHPPLSFLISWLKRIFQP
jgi:hypothetical protein